MKCEELLAALNDFVDGETQSAICQAFQEHLVECDPCKIVIDNIRQTISLYRADEMVPLPAGLHNRLRSVLRAQWVEKSSAPRYPR